ncbi:MAG: 50S ribosomal protein L13 [bacterium]|nr:50S ribosomal protein L13 [bacterium]
MAKQYPITRGEHTIDATGRTIGRIATEVAHLLRGKHKPTFTPHIDAGDFVRIVHLRSARFTGKKLEQKEYMKHSHYPGGLKRELLQTRWDRDPARVLHDAVRLMLPANTLRRHMLRRLRIDV